VLQREAPTSAYDEQARSFAFGAYRGRVERADLGRARVGTIERLRREKRWLYVAVVTDEVFAAAAIVRLGYASKAFWFAYDLGERRMLVSSMTLGPPGLARVRPVGTRETGEVATYSGLATIARDGDGNGIAVSLERGKFGLSLRAAGGPPAITAIADVPGGIVNVTEKCALVPASGALVVGGRSYRLDGGLAGYDHTAGLLARHTTWRWSFAMGRDTSGAPVAWNLTQGFVGARECIVWSGGEPHVAPEPSFTIGAAGDDSPWRLDADGLALSLTPGARHEEKDDLGVVRARFCQAVGTYSGTLHASGRALDVSSVVGVAEDQDVLW
jgi:hypothetical protein